MGLPLPVRCHHERASHQPIDPDRVRSAWAAPNGRERVFSIPRPDWWKIRKEQAPM